MSKEDLGKLIDNKKFSKTMYCYGDDKLGNFIKEIYFDDFEDPCEEFTEVLYDFIPENLVENELKKIKGIKSKHGKFYSVEKIKKK